MHSAFILPPQRMVILGVKWAFLLVTGKRISVFNLPSLNYQDSPAFCLRSRCYLMPPLVELEKSAHELGKKLTIGLEKVSIKSFELCNYEKLLQIFATLKSNTEE